MTPPIEEEEESELERATRRAPSALSNAAGFALTIAVILFVMYVVPA